MSSDTDNLTRHCISVPASAFDEPTTQTIVSPFADSTQRAQYTDDETQNISPNNNFGIVQYDLYIDKTFVSNSFGGQTRANTFVSNGTAYDAIESEDVVIYEIVAGNNGPAPAMNVTVTDYIPTNLTVTDVRLTNSVVSTLVDVSDLVIDRTSTPGEIIITMPQFMFADDVYTFEVEGTMIGDHEEIINNLATIYTPAGTDDVIEANYSIG